MNQTHAQPIYPTNSIEDSLTTAHQAANRTSETLDVIWALLTGDGAPPVPSEPDYPQGILRSADTLAAKLNVIAGRLEEVRYRLSDPKPTVPLTGTYVGASSGGALGKGYESRNFS